MNHKTRAMLIKQLEDSKVREKLIAMEKDPALNTRHTSFSANTALYPDGRIPFAEKHIAYLMQHPKLDPEQYLSNLRLMLRKR